MDERFILFINSFLYPKKRRQQHG